MGNFDFDFGQQDFRPADIIQVVELLQTLNPGGAPDIDTIMGFIMIGGNSLLAAADSTVSMGIDRSMQMSQLAAFGWHVEDYSGMPGFASEVGDTSYDDSAPTTMFFAL